MVEDAAELGIGLVETEMAGSVPIAGVGADLSIDRPNSQRQGADEQGAAWKESSAQAEARIPTGMPEVGYVLWMAGSGSSCPRIAVGSPGKSDADGPWK
jgi:hypothetical protein